MALDDNHLFTINPIGDLDSLIDEAAANQASRLLILAGKPIVCRVNGELSQPLRPERPHFRQMETLAAALLTEEQATELDKAGAVEIDYTPGTTVAKLETMRLNVFFGDGSHNVVVFLKPER